MTAHSIFSASASERWLNCSGSVRLAAWAKLGGPGSGYALDDPQLLIYADAAEAGPGEESEYAAEGVMAHNMAARCFARGCDAATYIGKLGKGATAEMAAAVQVYLDTVRADKAQHGGTLLVEQRIRLPGIDGRMYGTADAALVHDFGLIVYDYKHGKGVPVSVESPQLLYYAIGFILSRPLAQRITNVEVVVVQPRCDFFDQKVRRRVMPLAEIYDFILRLRAGVRAAEQPNPPRVPGKWCRFCPAAKLCPDREVTPHFVRPSPDDLFDNLAEGN